MRALPATILDADEHRPCGECGDDCAGRQAHFDERGYCYCFNCAAALSRAPRGADAGGRDG